MSCLSGLCTVCTVCLGCLCFLPTSNMASVLHVCTCISMYMISPVWIVMDNEY